MKTRTILFAAVSLCLITACSQELETMVNREKTSQEQAAEIENRVNAMRDSIAHYRDIPPDFTMRFENDTMTNTIWGHLGSPIHFGHIVSAERDFSYEFGSHTPLPADIEEINATTLRVVSDALPSDCPIILKNIQQKGEHLLFDIEVCGDKLGSIDLESPHFSESIGTKGWGPGAKKVVEWITKNILGPSGGEYVYQKMKELGNSGNSGNSNNDARLACINSMMTQTRWCIEKRGTASWGHGPTGNCPAGCWFNCDQKP